MYSTPNPLKRQKSNQLADRINSVERSTNADVIFFQQNRKYINSIPKIFSIVQLTNFKSGKENKSFKKKKIVLKTNKKNCFNLFCDEEASSKWFDSKIQKKKKFQKNYYDKSNPLEQLNPQMMEILT